MRFGSQDSEVRGKTDEDKWKVETTVDNVNVDDFVNPNRPKKGLNTVKRIPSPPCIRIFQKNDRNDRDTENTAQYTFLHVMDSEICSEHLNFICICLVRAFRIDIFCICLVRVFRIDIFCLHLLVRVFRIDIFCICLVRVFRIDIFCSRFSGVAKRPSVL